MTAAYRDAIEYLAALEAVRGWDLGLDRVRRALALRGNPERDLRVLHVGGTNGKGSTAAVLESVLRASGRRTGLYTSPHLVDFVERIRAGGRTMPHDAVVDAVAELRSCFERHDLRLTHFEFVTILAFEWFARIGVDVAVVEVGLGGRLDATNVVAPMATTITSIARDHEEFLGEGIQAIAREKAGIVKPGVPLSLGRLPVEAEDIIAAVARDRGAPAFRSGVDCAWSSDATDEAFEGPGVRWDGLQIPWDAPWQREAVALALLTLATVRAPCPVATAAVREGVATTRWPGRLMVVPGSPRLILDGAHNPAGAEALAAELPRLLGSEPATVLFACGRDRDWDAMVGSMSPWTRSAIVTEVGRRAAPADVVAEAFRRRGIAAAAEPEPARAIDVAFEMGRDSSVVVTGSLFLVGAVLARIEPTLWLPWHGWEVDGREPPR